MVPNTMLCLDLFQAEVDGYSGPTNQILEKTLNPRSPEPDVLKNMKNLNHYNCSIVNLTILSCIVQLFHCIVINSRKVMFYK